MDERKDWTVEVWRLDRRLKVGRRLLEKHDYRDQTLDSMKAIMAGLNHAPNRYLLELRETWVTRRNAMSGEQFQERYDTPWCCSPASESYHCS